METYSFLVLDAFTKASSQNPDVIKIAEDQLKRLELDQGFYQTLTAIVINRDIDVPIRWMAAVYLKNGVDRYWRRMSERCISSEDKVVLRQKFLTTIDEPVNQIASQIALIISRIARIDCPREWPELIPTLLNVIQLPDDVPQQRGLLVLHQVIKTLSSKILAGDRRIFQQLAASIFPTILQLWITHCTVFLQEIQQMNTNHKLLLDKCVFCLKILKLLVVYGFKDPSKEADAMNLFRLIFEQLKLFLDCRKCMGQDLLLETCEKYLVLLIKVLRNVLEQHPFAFVQLIQPSLECVVTLCFTKEYMGAIFERLIVQLFNLMKSILMCQEYTPAKCIEDTKNPLTLEADKIKKAFFSPPVLGEICNQLISRYFLLSETDLKNWEENPEEFASDEGGESWKYSLRPSTEVLFLALFREFRLNVTPLVMQMIKEIQCLESTNGMNILRKEAVYNAVGLAAFHLYDDLDFDKLFTDVLIPELQLKDNSHYVVKRRAVWLIGQWVGVKFSFHLKPLLYQTILELLKSDKNLVVRVTAANTLKSAVDDFEFCTEQFFPYLEPSITALFGLLKEVKEYDLKMSVLHVLSYVIGRMGHHVRPFAECLMQYLPNLWQNCGDHNLLRCAIITCFIHIVEALGTSSEKLHPFLLPMIDLSTDMSLPHHVYLLEDGLDLWWTVLDNTSVCSAALLNLSANIIPLLDYASENLTKCLQILNAYILLSPKEFLQKYGESIVNTFAYILTDMKSEGIVKVMQVVETALIAFPVEASEFFKPVLAKALSLILENDSLPLALSVYLTVLSRVVLHNQKCFGTLLQDKAREFNKENEEVLSNLLDIWLEKMPFVNLPENRKLMGLALASLLTSNSGVVHYQICGVLLAVVEVLNDITKVEGSEPLADSLVIKMDCPSDNEFEEQYREETEHERRKREISKQDPVYNVVLKDYLYSQMKALEHSVGSTKFQDLMSTVDVETMQQLRGYL